MVMILMVQSSREYGKSIQSIPCLRENFKFFNIGLVMIDWLPLLG
jgi:hypothetical protein